MAKNDKKSLKDQIIISFEGFKDVAKSPRHLSSGNVDSLRACIEVHKVDLSCNNPYRMQDNLIESRVLGSLLKAEAVA